MKDEFLPPTDEEKITKYGCAYCCAVGACPRCHGRAAITAATAELDTLRKERAFSEKHNEESAAAIDDLWRKLKAAEAERDALRKERDAEKEYAAETHARFEAMNDRITKEQRRAAAAEERERGLRAILAEVVEEVEGGRTDLPEATWEKVKDAALTPTPAKTEPDECQQCGSMTYAPCPDCQPKTEPKP